ncbi:tetratricopeptide repeat protein [Methylobacillus flagellatus]|uniref:protein O-GlcNAc transferase n=1 Tax=Methylobacillus flagellatus (strain ATCC 51484 / DSM 6875 / VKM B-1610 / KT) TaxID=265072 RepID=Q1GXY5_METFK|nr:tetratricopeptide repeat protein [Methylobacillus flagellatus]ABE50902.1 Tetratricopeptide TPR_2 [Methylobacillus flagellatus KT]
MSYQPSAHSQALFKAGLAAEAEHNYLEALSKYTASLEAGNGQIQTWLRIGNLFLRTMKYQQAAETMEFVLGMDPQNIEAIYGLAIAYFYLGRHEEACAFIDHVAETAPDNATYALDRANIHSLARPDPARKRQLYEAWGQRFADPLGKHPAAFDHDRAPDRVLRIGYVSGDMRHHAVAYFMEPVFAHHDPAQVETFVYATSREQDAVTERLRQYVPHWHDVSRLNDEALHALIRQHKIDILVDLSGHTHGNRLFVFARRAAPVQVTWLGYVGSTLGMQGMDYRLTDWGMDPAGNERYYVEKLFRLHCMASYIPPDDAPLEPVPPMLQGNPPTLASLNSSRKLTDSALLVWKQILEARLDAQLLIHVQEKSVEDAVNTIEPRLIRLGLPLDRIIVSPMVPMEEFMTRGQIVDIALDSFPVSGGTTTLHTLWMGLPIIAMDATDAVSASTASTLKGLGLHDWVAATEEAYVAKVLHLLDHPEYLVEHRARARQLLQQSVLMDYAGRCRDLETAYRQLWLNHLLGEPRFLTLHTPYSEDLQQLRKTYEAEQARAL